MNDAHRSSSALRPLLASLAFVAACGDPPPPAGPPPLVITHVTVLPMTADPSTDAPRALADRSVVVEDGVITAIADASSVPIPNGAVVVDGSGEYLVPGLVDMHVHFVDPHELPMHVAYGVTTVRNMGDFPDEEIDPASWATNTYYNSTLEVRAQVEAGALLGPDMVLAGHLLDGPVATLPGGSVPLAGPEQVEAAVRAEHDRGYDYIKVYDGLPADSFARILEVAGSLDIPVVGHAPLALSFPEILASGLVSNEHLTMFRHADQILPMMDEIGTMTAKSGIWSCPTLVALGHALPPESEGFASFFAEPQWTYLSPQTQAFVHEYLGTAYYEVFPGEYMDVYFRPITTELVDAGARLLVGTDAPFGALPGIGLHQELEALVTAGMTPYQALRAATHDATAALEQRDRFGTIEVGQRADLVLLREDPLVDIRNTQSIDGVMLRGRWMPRGELDGLLASLEQP